MDRWRMPSNKTMAPLKMICGLIFTLVCLPIFWMHSKAAKVRNKYIRGTLLTIMFPIGAINDFVISPILEDILST